MPGPPYPSHESPTRVLVVDDSPTARALLVSILGSDPEVEVIGEGRDGEEAVELTRRLRPHLVTMDICMPRMDGFQATKEIMIAAPTPIVLVTGSFEKAEIEISMHALRAGALTVLTKPPGPASPAHEQAARELLATVKAMAQVKVVRQRRPRPHPAASAPSGIGKEASKRVVAIATSTGGPAALQHLLGELPRDFAAPVLVVQHITPGFIGGLATWLDTVCEFQVKVAADGETLRRGTVYLAPDGHHLGVTSCGTVALSAEAPVGGFRPSGSFLFESIAAVYGSSAVAVILTGMGEDGVQGLRAIRRTGGQIIAQDEKSCVVFGMPAAAITADLADLVLPITAIPSKLVEIVQP